MSIEDIKIIIGLICVGLFQFFSLKFSYWKLRDTLKGIQTNLTDLNRDVKSLSKMFDDHEERISKLEQVFSNIDLEQFKKTAENMQELSKKQEILMRFIAAKKKEFER